MAGWRYRLWWRVSVARRLAKSRVLEVIVCFLASWAIAGPVGTVTGPAVAVPLLVLLWPTFCLVWLSTRLRPRCSTVRRVLDGLETERLQLRVPTADDASAIAANIDELVVHNNGWKEAPSVDALRRSAVFLRRSPGTVNLLIVERTTGAVLGEISCQLVLTHVRACQLGWWIGPDARDQGYATEAVDAAVRALQARAGPLVVVSETTADNLIARRLLEKTGAVETSEELVTLPNGTTVAGVWYVYAVPALAPSIPPPPPPPAPPPAGPISYF